MTNPREQRPELPEVLARFLKTDSEVVAIATSRWIFPNARYDSWERAENGERLWLSRACPGYPGVYVRRHQFVPSRNLGTEEFIFGQ